MNPGEESKKALEQVQIIEKWERQFRKSGNQRNGQKVKQKAQSEFAFEIAEKYKTELAWDVKLKRWKRYSSKIEGVWSEELEEIVSRLVMAEIEATGQPFTAGTIRGIIYLLKAFLVVRKRNEKA